MPIIPTIDSNLASDLNDLEIQANQLFQVARMCPLTPVCLHQLSKTIKIVVM